MSNHYSAANLKFPGDDARLDLTDLFVFSAPADPDRTVLIIDVNPFWSGMTSMPPFLLNSGFHQDAVYRINIDNDGDFLADVAFSFSFSELLGGLQGGTAYYATGDEVGQPPGLGRLLVESTPVGFDDNASAVDAGGCKLFVGVRSDPFFADAEGSFHGFNWTGTDAFANKNVLSIALEVPNEMLYGTGTAIGVWATVTLKRDGKWIQVDRGGHPTINPFINPNEVKDEYNAGQPVDDIEKYLKPWSEFLQKNGGYSADGASSAALTVLPDILKYDHAHPAAYPNGRKVTDPTFDARMAFLTNGKASPQGLGPHDDLLDEFPFLGAPNFVPA